MWHLIGPRKWPQKCLPFQNLENVYGWMHLVFAFVAENQFWVRLEGDHPFHRWKRRLWPLLQLREWPADVELLWERSRKPTALTFHFTSQLLYSEKNYVSHVQETLDYLHKEVKKTPDMLRFQVYMLSGWQFVSINRAVTLSGAPSSGELNRASPYHPPERNAHGRVS